MPAKRSNNKSGRRSRFELLEPRWALTAQITGVVWQDLDADAVRDAGEPAASGAVIYLDLDHDGARDNGEPTTTTDNLGAYSFTVAPGNYRVRQELPVEGVQTSPAPAPTVAIIDSSNKILSHRNAAGAVLWQTPIPAFDTGTGSNSEVPRELDVTDDGRVVVFNGTSAPRLSIYDQTTNSWTHYTHPGWATSNNSRKGGVAYADGYAFVTDAYFYGDDPTGVVRFDVDTGDAIRIPSWDPAEVVAGLDGRIYVSNQGGELGIIDPQSGQVLGSTGHTGIGLPIPAVDAAGRIYAPYYSRGGIAVYSPAGKEIGLIPVPSTLNWSQTRDIDLAPDGQIMLTTDDGRVIISDTSRTRFTSFVAIQGLRINGAWYSGHELTEASLVTATDSSTATANFGLFRLRPDPPAAPQLAATHNSGLTSDLRTNRNNSSPAKNLAFTINDTLPGAIVEVYADGTLIGSVTAASSTTLVTSNGSIPLTDGTRTITARQRFDGFESSVVSAPLALVIDATPPQVTVNSLVTDALRPVLTGSVSEPAAVTVMVDGQLYVAQVEGSTWSLPGGALTANLNAGTHHITAIAVDVVENTASDATTGELTIVPPTSQIAGALWEDVDTDGIHDANEIGWSGIRVYLDLNHNATLDAGEPTTTTAQDTDGTPVDESGRYLFTELFHGAYDVRIVLPTGVEQTTAITTAWPTADAFQVVESPRSERLLQFGELVAAGGDRFAVVSRQPASMGRQGQLVEIYRSIDSQIFHEGEIVVPPGEPYGSQITSLAIDGDSLLIGLAYQPVGAREFAGNVLAYRRVAGAWQYEATLPNPDPIAQQFGSGLALHGDLAVVGAPWGDYQGTIRGSIYIYERTAAGWILRQSLQSPGAGGYYEEFGKNLVASDDTIAIGTPGVNKVYVTQRTIAGWTTPQELTYPTATVPVLELGDSLAIDNDLLLVGGPGHYGAQALVFRKIDDQWTFEDNIGGLYSDWDFGDGVALVQGHAIVSEPFFDGPTTWSGVLHAFDNDGDQWIESQQILPDANGQIFFGRMLAGIEDAVLVGLFGDSTNTYGAGSVRVIRPQDSPNAVIVSTPLSGAAQAADIGLARRPETPQLVDAHDTGPSIGDGVTSRNNAGLDRRLTFNVAGVPIGSHVELWIDDYLAAAAIANSTVATLTTDGITKLDEGPHAVRALLRYPDGSASRASEAAALVVDSFAPAVDFDPLATAAASPQLEFTASTDVAAIEATIGTQTLTAEYVAGVWIVRAGTLAPLAPAVYDVTLRAVDVAGNVQQTTIASGLKITPLGRIEGAIFQDLDGDRRRNSGEPGLAGVVVYLDLDGDRRRDDSEPWQTTLADIPATPADETGAYSFANLVEAGYVVRIETPSGFEAVTPITEYGAWRSAVHVDSLRLLQQDMYDNLGGLIDADGNVMALSATMHSAYVNHWAAAIFERDDAASSWRQVKIIDSSDVDVLSTYGSRFGSLLAVGDGFVVFGAPGDYALPDGQQSGSLFVFERDPLDGVWKQTSKLLSPPSESRTFIGSSLAADGNFFAVGAVVTENDVQRGHVYVYEKSASAPDGWRLAADIESPATGNTYDFGVVVDLQGDRLIVGAPAEGGYTTGAAYLYRRSPTNPDSWILEHQFRSTAALPRSQVGVEADLEGDLLALRSSGVVDLYDLSAPTPRLIKSLPSQAYAGAGGGAVNAVSLSGRILALLDGSWPESANDIWIRDATNTDDWTLVNKVPTDGYGPFVSGDQLFVARTSVNDVPTYSGQVLLYETARGGGNRTIDLAPGEEARDVAFALVAREGTFPGADFNGDQSTDGADFLAWQRGLGRTGGATREQGDANGDGTVNAADLAIWQAQFGDVSPPPAPSAATVPSAVSAIDAVLSSTIALTPVVKLKHDAVITFLESPYSKPHAAQTKSFTRRSQIEYLHDQPIAPSRELYSTSAPTVRLCDFVIKRIEHGDAEDPSDAPNTPDLGLPARLKPRVSRTR